MNPDFTLTDFASLAPLSIILGASLLLLLLETFAGAAARKISAFLAFLGVATAFYFALNSPASTHPLLTRWIAFDPLGRFFTLLFLGIGLGSSALSSSFFRRFEASRGEYFFLLLSSLFGLILIGLSADFLTLFLGLETLSLSLYVLCGYMKKWELSSEAAVKYFLMGALAAAFLLFGIALIYGATGTTRFSELLPVFRALAGSSEKALFLGGAALVTLGLAFKAAVVPFHVWAPDVYEGAPTPVTAFMVVGTKAGAFAAFARVFLGALPQFDPLWNQVLAILAIPTLIYANWVAIRQTQLRRFFAYSGISHAGFLLIPLAAGTAEALPSIAFYLVIYTLATLGAFAVIAFIDDRDEGVFLDDLRGFFRRSPILAGILAVCFLTLAGIPPTAGFFAKFYLFKVAFSAGYYSLVIVGLLTTILSAFYYLRWVAVMFAETPVEETPPAPSWPAAVLGLACFALILFLSCWPAPLLALFSKF